MRFSCRNLARVSFIFVGSAYPTPRCDGKLIHVTCNGNRGFSVTRVAYLKDRLYFQAKGTHDHSRPLLKFYAPRQISRARNFTPTSAKKLDKERIKWGLLNWSDPFCQIAHTRHRPFQV